MEKVTMILGKPPYGDIGAAEAVRHALGAVSEGISVSLILVDGGVELAREGQDDKGTGFTNLGETLKDCMEMGVSVLADSLSLVGHGLKREDMAGGVQAADESLIAELVRSADRTMIF